MKGRDGMYWLRKLFNPEIFQGKYKKKEYFEGWYFKIIDRSLEHALAVIPGVSLGEDGHAFIQVLDSRRSQVHYLRYDLDSFRYSEKGFEVEIGGNRFSDKGIFLDIDRDGLRISGELSFENVVKFPKSVLRPGIMGPYSFVPFMECYHGIVNIHEEVVGALSIGGELVDFSGGFGYVEKDWGRSFPESWVWLQSNHFGEDRVSLMFSTAKIPWRGKFFVGFLSFLRVDSRVFLFASYTGARVRSLSYAGGVLRVVVEDRSYILEIEGVHSKGGVLKAPKNGLMDREVLESISAKVRVRLSRRSGGVVYEGEGSNTGLEVVSEILKYYE